MKLFYIYLLLLLLMGCSSETRVPNGEYKGTIQLIVTTDSATGFYSSRSMHEYHEDSIVSYGKSKVLISIPKLLKTTIIEEYPLDRTVLYCDSTLNSKLVLDELNSALIFVDTVLVNDCTYVCNTNVTIKWEDLVDTLYLDETIYTDKQQKEYRNAVNYGNQKYLEEYLSEFLSNVLPKSSSMKLNVLRIQNNMRCRAHSMAKGNDGYRLSLYESLPTQDTITMKFEIINK